MMVKKVYKYGTGEKIPDDAVYLTTIIEMREGLEFTRRFVWHYFIVTVEEERK
jgi:hypothetical protein